MGMYTEFVIGCSLSKKTPKVCIDALDYIINGEDKAPRPEKKDKWDTDYDNYIERTTSIEEIGKFIEEYDFSRLFCCTSYYFGAHDVTNKFAYDSISGDYVLMSRANLKNYSGQIEKFIKYIEPYVEDGSGPNDIFAYVQYEEDEFPTIYGVDGVYHVEDEETRGKIKDEDERKWKTLEKLFKQLAPEFSINEEECKKHNITPEESGNLTYIQVWEMMVEYIIEKYQKQFGKPDLHVIVPAGWEVEDYIDDGHGHRNVKEEDADGFKQGVEWAIKHIKENNQYKYDE